MEIETSLTVPPIFSRALNAAEKIARGLNSDITTDILFFALLNHPSRSFVVVLSNALINSGLTIESIVEYARGFCKKGRKKDGIVKLTKGAAEVLETLKDMSRKFGADYLAMELLPLSFMVCKPMPMVYAYILSHEAQQGVKPEDSFVQFLQEHTTSFLNKDLEILSPNEDEQENFAPELNFCKNLNKEAEAGRISEIEDFDNKIDEMAEILCKRVKPNIILVGEAGAGKTALAENLALKIVRGEVPTLIADKIVYSLSLSSLVAGTQYRGQMEKRLEDLMNEVTKYDNIILFIDEIHTIVHAGSGSEDGLDVSNILKPALSRGSISVIGATTLLEYQRTIKKDAALDRRFEKVVVRPPSSKVMDRLSEKILKQHAEFHGVEYTEEFRANLVRMCDANMPNRNYPDKAIDVVDKCGAAAKIEHFNFSLNEEEGVEEMNKRLQEFSDSPPPKVTFAHLTAYFGKKKNRLLASAKSGEFSDIEESLNFQKKAAAKVGAILRGENLNIYSHTGRPISFSLFGPTGTGKTFFLKQLSRFCTTNGIPCVTINGAEYNYHNAGYAFTEVKRGISLCEKVLSAPNTVIIIDDAEKLGESAANTLAQALKDGRLNAENGEIVDFTDSIFFFCANAESKKTMGFESATIKGASKLSENLAKACVHSVEFDTLTPEEILAFTRSRIEELRVKLQDNGLILEVSGAKMAAKTLDEALKLCESEIPRKVQEALSSGETMITI